MLEIVPLLYQAPPVVAWGQRMPCAIRVRRSMRSSVGGWVLSNFIMPAPRTAFIGLSMKSWAVAGFTFIGTFLAVSWSFSSARAVEEFVIEDIRIAGLQRLTPGTIFNYLPVEIGDTFNDQISAQSLRALFQTGFFDDVSFEYTPGVPVVRDVSFHAPAGSTTCRASSTGSKACVSSYASVETVLWDPAGHVLAFATQVMFFTFIE